MTSSLEKTMSSAGSNTAPVKWLWFLTASRSIGN